LRDKLTNLFFRILVAVAMALPYPARVRFFGWVVAHFVGPLAGYGARVRANLALVHPEMPEAEVRRLTRAVCDNIGRTLIETYSGAEFKARAAQSPTSGAGFAALEAAQHAGRPVVFVSGHFGNYDVLRSWLGARGQPVGALYRPFPNTHFDTHYRAAITAISGPIFPRGRRGLAEMLQHLRTGGMVGMLIDQHKWGAAALKFMGHTAFTATSAAEMALKYDALLLPFYGVRQPDGLSFELVIEAPIPRGTPEAMTQAVNDSLEAQVRAHIGQWFWITRRWPAKGD
jgi:KDO2-lipid IV(A) lauroyltransferase